MKQILTTTGISIKGISPNIASIAIILIRKSVKWISYPKQIQAILFVPRILQITQLFLQWFRDDLFNSATILAQQKRQPVGAVSA